MHFSLFSYSSDSCWGIRGNGNRGRHGSVGLQCDGESPSDGVLVPFLSARPGARRHEAGPGSQQQSDSDWGNGGRWGSVLVSGCQRGRERDCSDTARGLW